MKAIDSRTNEFERQLGEHGVRGALAWLNSRTPYRYAALCLVDGGMLKNVYVFDRDDPADKPYTSSPANESYSTLVMHAEQPIVIVDTLHDARATDYLHTTIRSYCGFPLRRVDGTVCGALCLFDEQPREIALPEQIVLDAASKLLSKALNQIASL
jgi:GAF domain-containing protein